MEHFICIHFTSIACTLFSDIPNMIKMWVATVSRGVIVWYVIAMGPTLVLVVVSFGHVGVRCIVWKIAVLLVEVSKTWLLCVAESIYMSISTTPPVSSAVTVIVDVIATATSILLLKSSSFVESTRMFLWRWRCIVVS